MPFSVNGNIVDTKAFVILVTSQSSTREPQKLYPVSSSTLHTHECNLYNHHCASFPCLSRWTSFSNENVKLLERHWLLEKKLAGKYFQFYHQCLTNLFIVAYLVYLNILFHQKRRYLTTTEYSTIELFH